MQNDNPKSLHILLQFVLPAAAIALVPWMMMDLYSTDDVSIQARYNLGVMNSARLADGLANYPRVWPPLYPTVLRAMHHATGLSAYAVNMVFFYAALVLTALFARAHIDRRWYLLPAALLAINNVFYRNASVISSETLMLAEALLLILVLGRHCRTPAYPTAFLMGLLSGVILYTRYFGLIWVFPTTVLCLLLVDTPLRRRIAHLLAYSLTAFVVSATWIAFIYTSTGHLTGMDRTGERSDITGEGMALLLGQTGFNQNVVGSLKTATFDLLSPLHIGVFQTVFLQPFSTYERLLALILLLVLVIVLAQVLWLARSRTAYREFRPAHIPALFTLSYVVLTIAVWTVGNNDPINTRFIFPVYPFLVLAACAVYAGITGVHRIGFAARSFLATVMVIYVVNRLVQWYLLSGKPAV